MNPLNNSSSPHCFALKVFYEDTDVGGIVYHANYVKFMERARTTLLEEKGLSLPTLMQEFGIQFVVRSMQITFFKPARLLEKIFVLTHVIALSKASFSFKQDIRFNPHDEGTIICTGEVNIVCTNLNFKPCGLPKAVRKGLDSES